MDITKSFHWDDATITVHRAKVRHRLAVDTVQTKLADGKDIATIMAVREFGRILTQSTVEGDVGFPLPPVTAPAETLQAAFDTWLDADAELMDIWQRALREVDSSLTKDTGSEKKAADSDSAT